MEDDDEFGDLYTDVLQPLTGSFQLQHPLTAAQHTGGGEEVEAEGSNAAESLQNIHTDPDVVKEEEHGSGMSSGVQKSDFDPILGTESSLRVEDRTTASQEEDKQPSPKVPVVSLNLKQKIEKPEGLVGTGIALNTLDLGAKSMEKRDAESQDEKFGDSKFEEEANIDVIVEANDGKDDDLVHKDDTIDSSAGRSGNGKSMGMELGDSEPMIPGVSVPGVSGATEIVKEGALVDEWESDSDDDDLHIVLNEHNHGPMGMDIIGGIGGDVDGEPLVMLADNDDLNHQPMVEEQEWGEELASSAEGEKREDATKVSIGPGFAPKIGYSNHGYHHPFHSQFKYVRPGAAPIPGAPPIGPGATPSQAHPQVNSSLVAGRGRGDWRPIGMKGPLATQKGFPGYPMPVWGSNSAGRGIGLDFTLPSHKTVFEVDIDGFDEKPWRLPGIDMSDFFNFGLNEESWKDYCKQLEQLRLESTMQGKIRVYESGRTEQEYDPDLPPELAAASVVQDVSTENASPGKAEHGQNDLARESTRGRPPLQPAGRPIQVETGSGDRLPSIDTRPPRLRDSDAIIEIVCQDSGDEENNSEQPRNQPSREDIRGGDEIRGFQPEDIHNADGFQHSYNGWRRDFSVRRADFNPGPHDMSQGDRITIHPSEELDSKGPSSGYPVRKHAITHDTNWEKGRARQRSSDIGASGSPNDKRAPHDDQREESLSVSSGGSPLSSSPASNRSVQEQERAVEDGNDPAAQRNSGVKRDKMAMDGRPNSSRAKTVSQVSSATNHNKLSSRLEDPSPQETEGREDSKASDNSKTRSGSSKEHHRKLLKGLEEEVHDERSTHREEDRLRRKGRDEKETGKHTMAVKGREDSYVRKGYDSRSSHHLHSKTSVSDWRKDHRDGDLHGRRSKVDDSRKHQNKSRDIDRSEREERHASRKQVDNGNLRSDHEKESGFRHRERDELKNRYDDMDDRHSKRRKEDTKPSREEASHARGDGSLRRKRERDEVRYKEEALLQSDRGERHRDRAEWYRHKQSHDEVHGGSRTGPQGKHEYKGSDREYHSKETGRHRSREDVYGRGNQPSNDDRRARTRQDHSAHESESLKVHEKKRRESSTKDRVSETGDHNSTLPARGDEDDRSGLASEKGSLKRKFENSSDENEEVPDSKRGRSKMERWASLKEKDLSNSPPSSSLPMKENEAITGPNAHHHPNESSKKADDKEQPQNENNYSAPETPTATATSADVKRVEDKHLETVEKLKKRSERFKLPLPGGDKETPPVKKVESESRLASVEPRPDSQVKAERPPRRRRWTSG